MRRTASEVLRNLERRVARLERKATTHRRAGGKGYSLVVDAITKLPGVKDESHAKSIITQAFEGMEDNWNDMGQRGYEEYMEKEIEAGVMAEEWRDNDTGDKKWQEKYFDFYIKSSRDASSWVENWIEEQLEDGLFD